MRIAWHSFFLLAVAGSVLTAQTVQQDSKFQENYKPGDTWKIRGSDLDKVTSVTLKAQGKTDVSVSDSKRAATELSFAIPLDSSGKYQVVLAPGNIPAIPLNVTPADKQPPPQTPAAQTPPPQSPPVINSVFPTTTYPVQSRFDFELNGDHFSSDPNDDQIEVDGQGLIEFKSRRTSPSPDAVRKPGQVIECTEGPKQYPCLEVTPDGHRLKVVGFERRHAYQGPLRVRVRTKDGVSEFSAFFTLSRVDQRIVVFLAIAIFALLMYVVYRLVAGGIQQYTIAGRKYSPLAAFLIDKATDSYSLSKFQLFAFSMVLFFGYVYVFLCRALVQWNFSFPEIPDNYPSLLAISAGTTVAAAGLTSARGTKGGGPVYPSAADFISNGGLVVPERFQFFVWTLIGCLGFIMLIFMQDPAKVDGFPSFPSGLLYVMGISAAGYLGGKTVRGAGPILKQVQVGLHKDSNGVDTVDLDVTIKGDNLDKTGKFRIDGASQAVIGSVNGTDQPQGAPGYCAQLDFTLSQGAGFAKGDHTLEITNRDGVGAQHIFTATPMKILFTVAITHGSKGPVNLTVLNYREGSSAQWLAPGASTPLEIAAADVKRTNLAPAGDTVTVTIPAGDKAGTGTLTLVSPLGGTEATSVTVI
jgi:hypothetical protein